MLEWTKHLMTYKDGRFCRDPTFCFHVLNFIQRHNNQQLGQIFSKKFYTDKPPTVQDIKAQIDNNDFTFVNKLQNFASTKIRACDGWWRYRKYELDDWISYHLKKGHGPPTLFLTFSCAEWWWSDLKKFLVQRCTGTLDEHLATQLQSLSFEEAKTIRGKLLDRYCVSVQQFFQHKMDNWLETVG